jgi:Bax protein
MSSDMTKPDLHPAFQRFADRFRSPAARLALAGLAVAAVLTLVLLIARISDRPDPLPDFAAIEQVGERKQAFFDYLAPQVRAANQRIREQRLRLFDIAAAADQGDRPGMFDRRWLARLSERYEVEWDPDQPLAQLDLLRERVDVVPVPLALVQAATESGWGRSRFAVEGNNLFGQWCYARGIVPARRVSGAAHEVATFDSVGESVRSYLLNLNTHEAYEPVREIRAGLRRADRPVTALALADGLIRYSERREAYVEEIKTVLRVNRPLLERVGGGL